jgi:hypothetical protein
MKKQMIITLDKFFHCVQGAATNYNKEFFDYWGVAFYKAEDARHCSLICSKGYVCDVRGIPEPGGEFFSFLKNAYTEYSYPTPIDSLLHILYGVQIEYIGEIITKNSNLINYVSSIPQIKREKSRLILYPAGKIDADEFMMRFDKESGDGRPMATINGIDKPFFAIEEAPFPASKIEKHEHYRCIVVGEDQGAFFVQAMERYGAVNMDMIYTQYVYDKDNLPERIPTDCFAFPEFHGNLPRMQPIHVDTNMFLTVLNILRLMKEDTDVHIHIPVNPCDPILISAADGTLEFNAKVQPLSGDHTKQRR